MLPAAGDIPHDVLAALRADAISAESSTVGMPAPFPGSATRPAMFSRGGPVRDRQVQPSGFRADPGQEAHRTRFSAEGRGLW
jgi:hypothetical protein